MPDSMTIFKDSRYYAAFTCAERARNGDILVAFRMAPREATINHFHSQSKAVFVRSTDEGRTWSAPEMLFPNYDLAQQDPHITCLPDGRLLAMAFTWQCHPKYERHTLVDAYMELPEVKDVIMRCAGVIAAQSCDDGHTWSFLGKIALNNADRSYWACAAMHSKVVALDSGALLCPFRVESASGYYTYIVRSDDGGQSWRYVSEVVRDKSPNHHNFYDEAFLQRLPSGRLVIELRSYTEGGLMDYAFSDDEGETWTKPTTSAVWGFPQSSQMLSDGRLLLTYGYRREPWGVRARIVKPDFSDVDSAEEIEVYSVSKDRAARVESPNDLGYPSAVELSGGRALITYYCYDLNDRTSCIKGTIIDL